MKIVSSHIKGGGSYAQAVKGPALKQEAGAFNSNNNTSILSGKEFQGARKTAPSIKNGQGRAMAPDYNIDKPLILYFKSNKSVINNGETCSLQYKFTGGTQAFIRKRTRNEKIAQLQAEISLSVAKPGRYATGTIKVKPLTHMIYELHVKNSQGTDTRAATIDVRSGNGFQKLAKKKSWDGKLIKNLKVKSQKKLEKYKVRIDVAYLIKPGTEVFWKAVGVGNGKEVESARYLIKGTGEGIHYYYLTPGFWILKAIAKVNGVVKDTKLLKVETDWDPSRGPGNLSLSVIGTKNNLYKKGRSIQLRCVYDQVKGWWGNLPPDWVDLYECDGANCQKSKTVAPTFINKLKTASGRAKIVYVFTVNPTRTLAYYCEAGNRHGGTSIRTEKVIVKIDGADNGFVIHKLTASPGKMELRKPVLFTYDVSNISGKGHNVPEVYYKNDCQANPAFRKINVMPELEEATVDGKKVTRGTFAWTPTEICKRHCFKLLFKNGFAEAEKELWLEMKVPHVNAPVIHSFRAERVDWHKNPVTLSWDIEYAEHAAIICRYKKSLKTAFTFTPSLSGKTARSRGSVSIPNRVLTSGMTCRLEVQNHDYITNSANIKKREIEIKIKPGDKGTPYTNGAYCEYFRVKKDWLSNKVTIEYSFSGMKSAIISVRDNLSSSKRGRPVRGLDCAGGTQVTGSFTHSPNSFPATYFLELTSIKDENGLVQTFIRSVTVK